MNLSRSLRLAILLLVLGSTSGCDQATKHLARTRLDPFDSVMLLGGFGELRLAENPGAFLSLGATLSPAARTFVFTTAAGIGLVVLFAYLLFGPGLPELVFAGLALILSGGVSNLFDRITRDGLVTDYLTLRCGPIQTGIFNLADVLVMIGMTLLLWAAWKKHHPPQPPKIHSG